MASARDYTRLGMGATKSAPLATGTQATPSRGIHVNVAGDIVGKLEEDAADRTFTVNAGQSYSYHFKSITSLGTATGNFLF